MLIDAGFSHPVKRLWEYYITSSVSAPLHSSQGQRPCCILHDITLHTSDYTLSSPNPPPPPGALCSSLKVILPSVYFYTGKSRHTQFISLNLVFIVRLWTTFWHFSGFFLINPFLGFGPFWMLCSSWHNRQQHAANALPSLYLCMFIRPSPDAL